jgi:hypothetical protein
VNEDEFESLRTWGEALSDDPRPEVRAAGRAIHLLAKEVERLQVELWHTRIGVSAPVGSSDANPGEETVAPAADPAMETELHSVFARVARRLHAPRMFNRG